MHKDIGALDAIRKAPSVTSTIKATIDDNEENIEETMQQRIKDLISIGDIKTKRMFDDLEEEK